MTAPALHIRPFTTADQGAARRLILDGLGEHFGTIDETCNPDLNDIWAHYMARGNLFVVAYAGSALVGTGGLCEVDDPDCGQIVRVSVSAQHRQHGIGRAIVAHLVRAARQRRLKRLLVETNHDWFAAIALYQRCGFTPYEQDHESVYLARTLD